MSENVSKIREFLSLECSIFTITHSCFKKCLKTNLERDGVLIDPSNYFMQKSGYAKDYEIFFLNCMERCSFSTISGRRQVRDSFLQRMEEVSDLNQKRFDGIYGSDSE